MNVIFYILSESLYNLYISYNMIIAF